jgi:hypothetical protein
VAAACAWRPAAARLSRLHRQRPRDRHGPPWQRLAARPLDRGRSPLPAAMPGGPPATRGSTNSTMPCKPSATSPSEPRCPPTSIRWPWRSTCAASCRAHGGGDLVGRSLVRGLICRTSSDCTTAPRNGLRSGCYPLDAYYTALPEAAETKAIKSKEV